MKKPYLLILALSLSTVAQAIQTAYVSFQEPENWGCELAQGVWICQSGAPTDRKESVILSIATQATEWDSLENYEKYLKRPRRIQGQDGNVLLSKITYTRRKNINGQWWVDSLQYNSELPGFYSRYLATIHKTKDANLAILITYIVSEDKYKKLAPQFMRMVASLKPATNFNLASKQGNEFLDGSSSLGSLQQDIIRERLQPKAEASPVEEAPSDSPMGALLFAGIVAGGALVYLRKRRKKQAKKQAKKRSARRAPTQLRQHG